MSVPDEPEELRSDSLHEIDMSDELVEERHKYSSLRVFQQPLRLIENDKNGDFSIVKKVLDEISQIDLTVNVIAITGPFRCGKSYLMNKLANAKHGFTVGNGVEGETKGVWAWCLMHPVQKDQVLLLLDTEGIGDAQKEHSQNDNKLLCITALICSTFIYNVKGVIDRDTLDKLGFVTYFATNITVQEGKPQTVLKSDIGMYLPKFVLCLRDFSYDLGEESPCEYIESRLTLQEETSDSNQHERDRYNKIRVCIRQFFVDRACFVFDPPAAGRKKLATLQNLDEHDILPTFKEDIKGFKESIYGYLPKKLLDGKYLNGNMFTFLVKIYVQKINSGGIPCIQDALTAMASQENKIILKNVVQEFEQEISSIHLPVYDLKEIQKKHKEAQTSALREFQERCIFTIERELFKEFEKDMDEICKKAAESNIKIQKERCNSTIKESYDSGIKRKLNEGHYRNENGYLMFKSHIRDLKSEIKQQFPEMDQTMLDATLNEFENSHLDDEMIAVQMTEENRKEIKDEHEKEKQAISKRLQKRLKKEREEFQQWKNEMENERKKNVEETENRIKEMFEQWNAEKTKLSEQLQNQCEKIETLFDLLEKEAEENKPTTKRTAARVASSLLPIFGPAINDAIERRDYWKRKEEREKQVLKIKKEVGKK